MEEDIKRALNILETHKDARDAADRGFLKAFAKKYFDFSGFNPSDIAAQLSTNPELSEIYYRAPLKTLA